MMTDPGYDVEKAAQVAAYLTLKSGKQINVLKLVKLLYLAERDFIANYDFPMIGDKLVSMDHGPVLSKTLNYINGTMESESWSHYIASRAGYNLGLACNSLSVEELDRLSVADRRILDNIWQKYGELDKYKLRDLTHEICKEWEDPEGSSNPITYERLLKFLGKENAEELSKYFHNWGELQNKISKSG